MSKAAVEEVSSIQELEQSVDDSLSQYGMSVDPFADDAFRYVEDGVNPFYMGGDRRSVLDEVAHLCQFNNNLVAVLGEAGVGKTALVQQVLIELQDTAQCCLIQSSVMATIEDVFQQLSSHLGVYIEPESSIEQMLMAVAQYKPSGLQQRVVVVVDDAHHLNDLVLSALIRLLQEQSGYYLHVLLVGDSSLLLRLDQLDKGDILAYDIPLCPFTIEELEQYLTFKLSVVGYQGAELFDVDAVQAIWRDTRGIPASANRAARQMLLNHNLTEDDDRTLGLPIWHMAMVVVLLAALIMAIFYVGDEEASSPDFSGSDAAEESVAVQPQAQPQTNPQAEPQAKSQAESAPPALEKESLVNNAEVVPASGDQPASSEINSGRDNGVDGSPVGKSESLKEKLGGNPSVREGSVVPEPAVAVGPESAPKPPSNPTSSGTSSQKATAASSVRDSLPQAEKVSPVSSSRVLTNDEREVQQWPPESYTLQVMAAGQLSGIQRFVDQQSNKNDLRIVAIERNGSPWYIVLAGTYSTLPEARQAIQNLPPRQSSAKPWPRKVEQVQREIK